MVLRGRSSFSVRIVRRNGPRRRRISVQSVLKLWPVIFVSTVVSDPIDSFQPVLSTPFFVDATIQQRRANPKDNDDADARGDDGNLHVGQPRNTVVWKKM